MNGDAGNLPGAGEGGDGAALVMGNLFNSHFQASSGSRGNSQRGATIFLMKK